MAVIKFALNQVIKLYISIVHRIKLCILCISYSVMKYGISSQVLNFKIKFNTFNIYYSGIIT